MRASLILEDRETDLLEDYQRSPLSLFMLYPTRQHVPAKTRRFVELIVDWFA